MRWLVLALAALVACKRPEMARPPVDAAPPPRVKALTRADFTGSAACGSCHTAKVAAWRKDWHARALAAASRDTVAGTFPAHFKGPSSEASMRADGDAFVMQTEGVDHPISWVIGGKRMQDSATVFPDGRWQVLPVYFHVTAHEWVDYTEAKQGALTPEHPFYWKNFRRTANRECLDCHATGLFVGYDPARHTFTTDFADAGVGCEACHGPGARHADTQEVADVFRPQKASPEQQLAVCGQCHTPRNPLFPLLDAQRRFRPGDRYDERYQALVVVDGAQRSGDYFADGRPAVSSFELVALLESRCHLKGGTTCLTCHAAPHATHDAPPPPDAACQKCHDEGPAHTHHQDAQAQRCVACHMPPVVTGVLDRFADHALDVPNPGVTERHGVPNACNACHAHDHTPPADMAAALLRLWPGAERRQARRARLADAIDETTAARSRDALLGVVADAAEAPVLRGACAVLLAQRFPADTPAVLAPLLRDADPLLRARAAEALGYTHLRAAADLVAPLATGDPALAARQAATVSLALLGDAPRAEAAAGALTRDPEGGFLPQPHVVAGVLAERRGDLAGAAAELERAVAIVPYHADALVWLAGVRRKQGRLADARRALEDALRFAPDHARARKALAELPPGSP